jgi:hypothetical protein
MRPVARASNARVVVNMIHKIVELGMTVQPVKGGGRRSSVPLRRERPYIIRKLKMFTARRMKKMVRIMWDSFHRAQTRTAKMTACKWKDGN